MIFMTSLIPVSVHATSGLVLCFESDGHISLEYAAGFSCVSEVVGLEDSDHAREHLTEDEDHCEDCLDVTVKGVPDTDCGSSIASSGPSFVEWMPSSWIVTVLPVWDDHHSSNVFSRLIASDSDTLSNLNSVVLLI